MLYTGYDLVYSGTISSGAVQVNTIAKKNQVTQDEIVSFSYNVIALLVTRRGNNSLYF